MDTKQRLRTQMVAFAALAIFMSTLVPKAHTLLHVVVVWGSCTFFWCVCIYSGWRLYHDGRK